MPHSSSSKMRAKAGRAVALILTVLWLLLLKEAKMERGCFLGVCKGCVRRVKKINVMRDHHSLAHLKIWGKMVTEMSDRKRIKQTTANKLMRILRSLTHGLCDPSPSWHRTSRQKTSTETNVIVRHPGRMPRRRRQALALMLLGSMGGLVLSEALKLILEGNEGGGKELEHYLKGLDEKERSLRHDILALDEGIKRLQGVALEAWLMGQIESLAIIELETWRQIISREKTRGDAILLKILEPTMKQWKELGLIKQGDLGGPFPIPEDAYRINIVGTSNRDCGQATMTITVVSLVPTKECNQLISNNSHRKFSLIDNHLGGCYVGTNIEQMTTLPDQTHLMRSSPWEMKRLCNEEILKNIAFKTRNETTFLFPGPGAEGTSICNNFLERKKLGGTSGWSMKFPCKGNIRTENKTLSFYSPSIEVTNRDIKILGNYTTGFLEAHVDDFIEEESGGERLEAEDEAVWGKGTEDHQQLVVQTVGSTTGGLFGAILLATGIWWWWHHRRSDEDRRISGLFERNNIGDEDYEINKLEKITAELSKLHKEFQDMEEQDTKEGPKDGADGEEPY